MLNSAVKSWKYTLEKLGRTVADKGSNSLWKEIGNYALLYKFNVDGISAAQREACLFPMCAKICVLRFFSSFFFSFFFNQTHRNRNFSTWEDKKQSVFSKSTAIRWITLLKNKQSLTRKSLFQDSSWCTVVLLWICTQMNVIKLTSNYGPGTMVISWSSFNVIYMWF